MADMNAAAPVETESSTLPNQILPASAPVETRSSALPNRIPNPTASGANDAGTVQSDGQRPSGVGRFMRTILGGVKTSYGPDPNNPNGPPVAHQEDMKPGELFRHILGASLLGLAAGSTSKDFGSGFAKGAGAGINAEEQADEKARNRAQQDWENQRQQTKDQQEAQRLEMEKGRSDAQVKLTQAQVLHTNALTYQAHIEGERSATGNLAAQNELYEKERLTSEPQVKMLQMAGIKPEKTVSDSEYNKMVSQNPEMAAMPHLVVGHHLESVPKLDDSGKQVIGDDGKPQMTTHSVEEIAVYDPQKFNGLKITKEFQDQLVYSMGVDPKNKAEADRVRRMLPVGKELTPTEGADLLTRV